MNPRGKTAAFFDLDETLIAVNSGALWLKRERRLGRISLWQMLHAMYYVVAYRFSAVDMESLMVRALQTVRGLEEETLRQWTHQWYQDEVADFAAPGAWPVLQGHRQKGHLLVLCTASSLYESEVACRQFGIQDFLCTRYQVVDGFLTGDVQRPICYGAGKVHFAEAYAQEHGIDLDTSYFYTDSYSDAPLLHRVGFPQVVHPDRRLARLAREKGWPILDWRQQNASA